MKLVSFKKERRLAVFEVEQQDFEKLNIDYVFFNKLASIKEKALYLRQFPFFIRTLANDGLELFKEKMTISPMENLGILSRFGFSEEGYLTIIMEVKAVSELENKRKFELLGYHLGKLNKKVVNYSYLIKSEKENDFITGFEIPNHFCLEHKSIYELDYLKKLSFNWNQVTSNFFKKNNLYYLEVIIKDEDLINNKNRLENSNYVTIMEFSKLVPIPTGERNILLKEKAVPFILKMLWGIMYDRFWFFGIVL